MNNQEVGKIYYSHYFGRNIVVVDYISDTEWSFVVVDEPHLGILKAKTSYSVFRQTTPTTIR